VAVRRVVACATEAHIVDVAELELARREVSLLLLQNGGLRGAARGAPALAGILT